MPERRTTCPIGQCLKLTGLAIALMLYELIFFVAFLSLSIGIGAGLKIALKYALNVDIHVALETYCSWYFLGVSTEMHMRLYKRCVYPKIRRKLRQHPNVLQGLPRLVYFILWFVAICGICYEYEAVHNYPPPASLSPPDQQSSKKKQNHNQPIKNGREPSSSSSTEFMLEVPMEKIHTALFLMCMSYMIYSTGQIMCNFLMRINRGLPPSPACPQVYATVVMMILQSILTVFYAFPIAMTLVACYLFHVDGSSAYMFSLCLATSIAMATAQLEGESPFPTEGRVGPFYYFEGLHRSRVNLIFLLLPAVAYYFFDKSPNYPAPSSGGYRHYHYFTFWLMVTLMHTIKTLYLTTWHPARPAVVAAGQNRHQNHPLDPAEVELPPPPPLVDADHRPLVHHVHLLPSSNNSGNNNNNNASQIITSTDIMEDPTLETMGVDENELDSVDGDNNAMRRNVVKDQLSVMPTIHIEGQHEDQFSKCKMDDSVEKVLTDNNYEGKKEIVQNSENLPPVLEKCEENDINNHNSHENVFRIEQE